MARSIKAFVVAVVALGLMAPAVASAGNCKNHMSKRRVAKRGNLNKKVKVKVRYKATQGYTIVDPTGIYFYVKGKGVRKGKHNYPKRYWYDAYPLYLVGKNLTYTVVVKNKSKRAIRNVRVVAQQEYLETNGKDGKDLPGCSSASWVIKKLRPGKVWKQTHVWRIPGGITSGLDQTHVQLQRNSKWSKKRKVLLDKPQAGVYCPPED